MNRLRNILTAMAVVAAMAAAAQFPNVVNPEIPAKVTFAGNTVSLDRDDMYERLDRELTSMAYTHGNTLLTIKRANRYFPVMAPILKRNGVPLDMLYLACIESTLNPRALSPAGAAGFWQLMPATAKEFGLEVNNFVDERYNLKKATEAACRYLKRAYSRYGNWESVAASYNGGMARISRELQAQGQNTAYNLYLTDETSRYMFRLLAMKLIMTRPADYGFSLKANQLYRAAECTPVKVSGPVDDWQQWAIDHGTTYMALRDHNPWIRAKSLPNKTGKTYTVMVPKPGAQMRSRQKPTVYDRNWVKD
ncbi:lytic transglycosylase domain-containing protein [Paramuribaculum intestinale]|uniref:lytic transglycosylase domain-containing protein n=1 Tax=Paramuribaculum intestinale TaxID=2094151 RepID=UPI00259C6B3D|nr:lytic transglycosylase domain-containing protein [Paramuribaculum intestinale]